MELQHQFNEHVHALLQKSKSSDTSVLQLANLENRKIVESIVEKLLLKGSAIHGIENLQKLYSLTQKGHSVLFLSEHYSNFDIPVLFYLIEKQLPNGRDITNKIIALATRRLNEHSDIVRAFAEGYNRITVYASRDVEKLEETASPEYKYAQEMNQAALSHVARLKDNGYIIFIFPAGTRYRPWNPQTKQPIPQIVSFIKRFDYVIFAGIAGVLLKVDPEGDMTKEEAQQDVISITLSDVVSCKEFCNSAIEATPETNPRQAILQKVTETLDGLHTQSLDFHKNTL